VGFLDLDMVLSETHLLLKFYFFHPMAFLACPIFSKNALDVSGFYNPEWCFPLLKGEKISYGFFWIL